MVCSLARSSVDFDKEATSFREEPATMVKDWITRRRFVTDSLMTATLAGAGTFYGPWQHNAAYAQAKPIKLGLTCDASGQWGARWRSERARGAWRSPGATSSSGPTPIATWGSSS